MNAAVGSSVVLDKEELPIAIPVAWSPKRAPPGSRGIIDLDRLKAKALIAAYALQEPA